MRLYTYTLAVDDGAAPNPFGGVCTLSICKPAIRRTSSEGDWIVGFGPTLAPDGRNLSASVIYAMKVGTKLSFEEYAAHCAKHLQIKIPKWDPGASFEQQVGDCIYYPSSGKLWQRKGVHNSGNYDTDLGGKFALISSVFYYFGDNPVELPEEFRAICHPYQGHKVHKNETYKEEVVRWIANGLGQNAQPGELYGKPLHRFRVNPRNTASTWSSCGSRRVSDFPDRCSIC